jgi:hypothetical protein
MANRVGKHIIWDLKGHIDAEVTEVIPAVYGQRPMDLLSIQIAKSSWRVVRVVISFTKI